MDQLPEATIAELKRAGCLPAGAGPESKCVPFVRSRAFLGAMQSICDHPGRPELRDHTTAYICAVVMNRAQWMWGEESRWTLYVGCCEMCGRIFYSSQVPVPPSMIVRN